MQTPSDAPVWEKLGFQSEFMESAARNLAESSPRWWNQSPESLKDVESWASDVSRDGMAGFAMGWLGYHFARPPLDDWRAVGRRLVSAVEYYLLGAWRERFMYFGEELDLARSRAELPWITYYREGLAVALSFGDWPAADRLVQWPAPGLRFDEGVMDDRSREDNAFHIWLALRLRGEPEAAWLPLRSAIERGTRRRPKMLLVAADALLAGDVPALTMALAKYLTHYRKNELSPTQPDEGVCLDATALWHLARRRGLGEIPLPPDLQILIPRP